MILSTSSTALLCVHFPRKIPTFCADLFGGEIDAINDDPIIKSCPVNIDDPLSKHDTRDNVQAKPVFHPEDLVGRSFLMDKQDDGQQHRATIIKTLEDHDSDLESNPTMLKFLLSVNQDDGEEIITYNQLLDYLSRDEAK